MQKVHSLLKSSIFPYFKFCLLSLVPIASLSQENLISFFSHHVWPQWDTFSVLLKQLIKSSSLLCQGEYPLVYVYLKGHQREVQDFPENSFVHAHISMSRICLLSAKEDALMVWEGRMLSGLWKAVLWWLFLFGFACMGMLSLGIKRKWDWIFQVAALLWRDWLIIPVTTEGKLRRLRAEGKTSPLLWKGIRPCWKPFPI